MSNPTELPDLDRLEALARAATAGPWKHYKARLRPGAATVVNEVQPMSGEAIVRWSGFDGMNKSKSAVTSDARFIAAANPAAVLALIALARRAQPEGEAPQAERKTIREVFEHVGGHWSGSDNLCPTFGSAEALRVYTIKMQRDAVRAAVAARQAAAPGSLPDQSLFEAQARYQGATNFEPVHPDFMVCNNGWTPATYRAPMTELAWRVWANKCVAPSSPGTPEAPADDHKGIALWNATMRACGELPEGYEVRIELESGCGMAVWYDAEGERHVIDGDGYLSDDVNEAVDAAIQRATQLDGGQGESHA